MSLKIVMAQLNLLVGDVRGNAERIIEAANRARDDFQADIVAFPELSLTGYPPEDLLLRPAFIEATEQAFDHVRESVKGIAVVLGYPRNRLGKLYNAAGVLRDGELLVEYFKHALPNYSVFDEKRYFTPGEQACVIEVKGVPIGITICEDVWEEGPVAQSVAAGAKLLLNINASPFDIEKSMRREQMLARHARKHQISIVYVNLVGGQDELVFDGGSFVINAAGDVTQHSPEFVECLSPVTFENLQPVHDQILVDDDLLARIYQALVLGIRDYVIKNGFRGVVLGLSGGIDSALVLALAVDALGADQVEVVMMPSRYTADMSNEDAALQARNLGVHYRSLPIEQPFTAFLDLLSDEFKGLPADVTEENIQARCRGILLMAISNKKGKMLLTTGNKSEMSVGYSTLYGDMAGGFAPIKDCPKLLVYQLAEYRNRRGQVIPQRVIERPPSAELRADQQDTDSLPDYAVLDEILRLYVELDLGVKAIVGMGFDEGLVKRIVRLVDVNEYKRRQAPPGIKITMRAYGRDRRYPITNGFSSSES
ncbi:MAG: NAD+ synthase [Chromatiales bacterium]|jgi:NAD+ synthase (glutamine-hydrolysing)